MEKLKKGDSVAVVSLSWGGAHAFPERFAMGVGVLENEFGLKVKLMPNAKKPAQWLADNPQARAQDLNKAFADSDVKAIFSSIGGDDSIRIIPFLDRDLIKRNPKIFMGYSDTTVTHLYLHNLGLTSFYGPAVMAGFAEAGGMLDYTRDALQSALFGDAKGLIPRNEDYWMNEEPDFRSHSLRKRIESVPRCSLQGKGKATGRLLGGCMEVLEFCRGTPVWPSLSAFKNGILFLEVAQGDTTTSPERLVWFLRSLASSGELHLVNGMLFGRPGQELEVTAYSAFENAICKVLKEEGLTDLPVISRVEFGHTDPMCILPYSTNAEVCADSCEIRLLEDPLRY